MVMKNTKMSWRSRNSRNVCALVARIDEASCPYVVVKYITTARTRNWAHEASRMIRSHFRASVERMPAFMITSHARPRGSRVPVNRRYP